MALMSFSIFSFNGSLLGKLVTRLGNVSDGCWIRLCLTLLGLLLGWWIVRKLRGNIRTIGVAFMIVMTLRVALLGNPISWMVYRTLLSTDDVGWRQNSVIAYGIAKDAKHRTGFRNLAVGSSQVEALFGRYARKHRDMGMFSMPGLGPIDYLLYKDHIAAREPDRILLYLSESDLARRPAFSAAKLGPPQRGYWVTLFRELGYRAFWKDAGGILAEIFVAEVLPEYKYSFVFRGLWDKAIGARKALGKVEVTNIPDDKLLEIHLKRLATTLAEENIEGQVAVVRTFIRFCEEKGISVVLLEGEYNPLALSEENLRLNRITRARLEGLADQCPHVTFFPRNTFARFGTSDFRDGYHLEKDAGYAYVERLVAHLDPAGS